jgi:pimeloyl-ACP methyl ester carboxylesterase
LLLPGTLCTRAVFDLQARALEQVAPGVEVVEFTRERSIGEMAQLVEQKIPPGTGAAVVGFSMGGMVAMAIARRNPQLVAKLALLNTNFHADIPGRYATRLEHLQEARTGGIGSVITRDYLPRYLHRHSSKLQQLIVDMAERSGLACFEAQIQALAGRRDSGDSLASINCPTLILGSAQDELCPPQGHVEMNRLIKGSKLVLLENCGHFSLLERPGAVNSALLDWYLED